MGINDGADDTHIEGGAYWRMKIEIVIVVVLVGFALTAQTTAFATKATTNEHDYKNGFRTAIEDYGCTTPAMANQSGCDTPTSDRAVVICTAAAENWKYEWGVTNKTACEVGYIDGWKHWCMTDTKDCAKDTTAGIFPGKLIFRKSSG
jgi:hypothetical protein